MGEIILELLVAYQCCTAKLTKQLAGHNNSYNIHRQNTKIGNLHAAVSVQRRVRMFVGWSTLVLIRGLRVVHSATSKQSNLIVLQLQWICQTTITTCQALERNSDVKLEKEI